MSYFNKRDADLYYKIFPPHINKYYLTKRIKFLRQFIKNDSKILDVGCGKGKLLSLLSGSKKFGIDNSKSMLNTARHSDKKYKIIISNAYSIPFKNNSFDFVYSVAVLHHIVSIFKVQECIKEIIRITKTKGTIVIWDHNSKNLYWKLLFKRIPWDKEVRIVRDIEYEKLVASMKVSSMKIMKSGFVPDFMSNSFLKIFQFLEKIIEKTFIGNFLAAHTILVIKQ